MTNCTKNSTLGTWQEEWNQRLLSLLQLFLSCMGSLRRVFFLLRRGPVYFAPFKHSHKGVKSVLSPNKPKLLASTVSCVPSWNTLLKYHSISLSYCSAGNSYLPANHLANRFNGKVVRALLIGRTHRGMKPLCDPALWDNLPSQQQEPLSFEDVVTIPQHPAKCQGGEGDIFQVKTAKTGLGRSSGCSRKRLTPHLDRWLLNCVFCRIRTEALLCLQRPGQPQHTDESSDRDSILFENHSIDSDALWSLNSNGIVNSGFMTPVHVGASMYSKDFSRNV